MIVNAKGNVLVPKSESNGHVSVEIFESAAIMAKHVATPMPETEPDRLSMYVGTKYTDAQEGVVDLGGLTLKEKLQAILEQVVVALLKENYKNLPRTKFENSDWVLK